MHCWGVPTPLLETISKCAHLGVSTLAASSTFDGAFAGSGTLRLMPDVAIAMSRGLGAFPRTRLEAVLADDGKERRVYVTPGPNGSCTLENRRVMDGTMLFVR